MNYVCTREIKSRIIENRKKKGITQSQMAEMLGMPYSSYGQKERYGTIEYGLLKEIAKILEVDITVLLYAEEIPEPPSKNNVSEEMYDELYKMIYNEIYAKLLDEFKNKLNNR